MYGLDYLNLCNSFKNRLQNSKDFLSLPALLKFSLRQCSSESLPVSCLQNIHIQSTISTIAINKEPFMPTCYNFISHTLYRKKVFSLLSSISEALMPCEKNAPFQCRGDRTVPYVKSTPRTVAGKTRWSKISFSFLTSRKVHGIGKGIIITRCRNSCGNGIVLPQDVFSLIFICCKG